MTSPTHSEDQQPDLQTQNPKMTQEQDQQPQPQSSQIQTLETPDLHDQTNDPDPSELDQHQQDPQVLDEEEEQDYAEGTPLSPSLPPIPDTHITIPDLAPENPPPLPTPTTASRRQPKKKKQTANRKRAAREKKLPILTQNLKPIPFVPNKTLDFPKHEKLLKRLGLWDFVNIEFDRHIRVDLLAQLIAFYYQSARSSYVNEVKIMVNRADLARAFKLPVKKDKSNPATLLSSEVMDCDSEVLSEESVSFIEDFVSNWVLLHEDTWMMPNEVLTWTKFIKEGHPERVDWAGLIWFMVEKELMQGSQLKHCYYASHLQYLIKLRLEEVLKEEPKVEVCVKEEEDGGDVKMGGSDDFRGQELEEHNIELNLGQDNVVKEEVGQADVVKEEVGQDDVVKEEFGQDNIVKVEVGQDIVVKEEVRDEDEDMMDFEESKEEEPGQWLLDGKNNVGEPFLQRCNLGEVRGLDCHEERKQEEEEEEEVEEEEEEGQEERFNLSPKCNTLEGLSSANLIQAMEVEQIPYSSPVQLCDQSSLELHVSRADTHAGPGGPSIFGNANKREIGLEHDISHHSLNGSHKRLRSDGSWDHKSPDFDTCMEQIENWMGKARMMYEAKEHAYTESNMNQQILLNELQRRDNVIEHLHKSNYEEINKRQMEIYRLERELYVMGNLLEGYRKSLKTTNRAFAEYREHCQMPDEPLYKDVGTGGVIMSTLELEKQRLKLEEEDRMKRAVIEEKVKDFEVEWIGKLEAHCNEVHLLGNKLPDFEKEVKHLKELFAKGKVLETSECTPNE